MAMYQLPLAFAHRPLGITPQEGWSPTGLNLFDFSSPCLFRCVFKLLAWDETYYSHTDYICLAFLHCVFSNVPSNRQPERRNIHTGYIHLFFGHCVITIETSPHRDSSWDINISSGFFEIYLYLIRIRHEIYVYHQDPSRDIFSSKCRYNSKTVM